MDQKQEYLTIAEFAEKVGISKQAVYKRLNNQLKPFIQLVENKKCLKIEALELYGLNQVEQPVEQPNSTTLIDLAEHLQKQYDSLTRLVDILRDDIDIKNEQIREANKRQEELSNNLTTTQQLLHQQQVLNLRSDVRLEESTSKPDEDIEEHYKKMFENSMRHMQELLEDYPEALKYLVENW